MEKYIGDYITTISYDSYMVIVYIIFNVFYLFVASGNTGGVVVS